MAILYLHAPYSKNNPATHHRDFYSIRASGVGPNYGIYSTIVGSISIGMPVVVFDSDRQLQAQGRLVKHYPTTKAGNGVQRYNLEMTKPLASQNYTPPPRLNYCGIAVAQ
jgi:hypothetical protein